MSTIVPVTLIAALSIFITYWLVCRPLAWHYVMFKNRHLRERVPPNVVWRPYPKDQQLVAINITSILCCLVVLILLVVILDLSVYVAVWQAVFADTAEPATAAGYGAVTVVGLLTSWTIVGCVRWLVRYHPAVHFIWPDTDTHLSSDRASGTNNQRSPPRVIY